MKTKELLNSVLGISAEILYAVSIILTAFLTCLTLLIIKR